MKCVEIFVEHGVDLNAVNEIGRTPLHQAAYSGYSSKGYVLLSVCLFRNKNLILYYSYSHFK